MIPALLAAPMVGGIVSNVVGGLVGGVVGAIAGGPTAPPATSTASFAQSLNSAAATTTANTPSGSLRATDWSQMSDTDVQSWGKSLAGSHVDATDASGRTISGLVSGVQLVGHDLSMNIGGHLVSLSQLKQINWSPSTV